MFALGVEEASLSDEIEKRSTGKNEEVGAAYRVEPVQYPTAV
jgi:hypothetical protein